MGPDAMILFFWILSFKPAFSLFFFTFTKRFFIPFWLYAIRVVSYAYLRLLLFLPGNLDSSLNFIQFHNLTYAFEELYIDIFFPKPYKNSLISIGRKTNILNNVWKGK